MRRSGPLTVAGALLYAVGFSVAVSAQEDCPRGTLDKAFCDRNGDLVADPPTDSKKLVDPSDADFLPTRRSKIRPSIRRSGTASSSTLRRSPGKRWCSSRCSRMRRSSRRCAPAVCTSRAFNAGGQRNCGELRGLRAVRDDGVEGQQLRLRDGNHRARRQPDQNAGRSQGHRSWLYRRNSNSGFKAPSAILEGRLQP